MIASTLPFSSSSSSISIFNSNSSNNTTLRKQSASKSHHLHQPSAWIISSRQVSKQSNTNTERFASQAGQQTTSFPFISASCSPQRHIFTFAKQHVRSPSKDQRFDGQVEPTRSIRHNIRRLIHSQPQLPSGSGVGDHIARTPTPSRAQASSIQVASYPGSKDGLLDVNRDGLCVPQFTKNT